ncbi:acyltransferase [Bacillus sp. AFS029533]|uniref:acyltransferase n=1 Tax=Bacillus sp. AFS029533 TaxID=2033494 RepID=UPI000BFB6FA6|nr:acyltransferase [Bacillus sp. AFS029533]PGZ91714.1 exopolysaccharide biosynthesis protein [Bacillus sp. AFS029533]
MRVLKIYFHIMALFKTKFYKLIFGERLDISNNVTFRRHFYLLIEEKGKISIGKGCFFNNNCSITSLKSVSIGEDTIFGENVKIYDHNHRFRDSSKKIKEQGFSVSDIKIGKHCWIGSNVTILKGAEIGDNCVIGAGCVIAKKIAPNSIVKLNYDYETIKIDHSERRVIIYE